MEKNNFTPFACHTQCAATTAGAISPRSMDGGEAVIPLPNPGEGGPVYPGDSGGDAVIPLPNPGEGGPVYPGNGGGAVIPLPNPGEGGPVYPGDSGPVYPGDSGGDAVIPLPNPGEGGPVYPGPGGGAVIPLPNPGEGGPVYPGNTGGSWGCSNCTTTVTTWRRTSSVRFLNAAYGYSAFRVHVGSGRFVSPLNYASASSYGRFRPGYHTVTVSGRDGYIYIQKSMLLQAGAASTIAIINTASGLDLLQITDSTSRPTGGFANLRIGNLAYNSGPMDVLMSDGRVVYSDLRFKEVGAFKRIRPGVYQFFYADTNLMAMPAGLDIETMDSAWLGVYPPHETFGSLYLDVVSGVNYSVYLLQSGPNHNNVQNLILMDR